MLSCSFNWDTAGFLCFFGLDFGIFTQYPQIGTSLSAPLLYHILILIMGTPTNGESRFRGRRAKGGSVEKESRSHPSSCKSLTPRV